MTLPDSLQRTISAMRPRFIAALAERLVILKSSRAAVAESGLLPQNLRTIQFLAHKTSGVSATLGFEELGKLTGRVDVGIEAYLRAPDEQSLHEPLIISIDQMIAAITDITEDPRNQAS